MEDCSVQRLSYELNYTWMPTCRRNLVVRGPLPRTSGFTSVSMPSTDSTGTPSRSVCRSPPLWLIDYDAPVLSIGRPYEFSCLVPMSWLSFSFFALSIQPSPLIFQEPSIQRLFSTIITTAVSAIDSERLLSGVRDRVRMFAEDFRRDDERSFRCSL